MWLDAVGSAMSARIAILCPGQGGQNAAMFDMARSDPQMSELLNQVIATAELGIELDGILTDSSLLFANRIAQPLIVAATLIAWESIRNDISAPVVVAGYSIGEVSAYGVAGALTISDAVALAAKRAGLMDACLRANAKQTLMAVSGLFAEAAEKILKQHDFHIAIKTGKDAFIVGGLASQLPKVQQDILSLGGQITVLPVEVASHTPYMSQAVTPFAEELKYHRFANPQFPVLAGISGEFIHQSDKAISHLSRQISETIQWADCMDACAEAGVTVALELGPGAALSRMLHSKFPQIECRSVADFRSFNGVKNWIVRHSA